MTYPVTVYRHTDAGAPQITAGANLYASANEIKAILDACLVNGYGSKAALGWSKVFDTTDGVVYQNNVSGGGSGGMFRFRPKSGSWTATNSTTFALAHEIQSAKSFSSATVFDKGGLPFTFNTQVVGSGLVKGWALIGTAIGFYLEFHTYDAAAASANTATRIIHNSSYYEQCFYVGDILPMIPGDAYTFIGFYNNQQSASPQSNMSTTFGLGNSVGVSVTMNSSPSSGIRFYDSDGGTGNKIYGSNSIIQQGASPFAANAADPIMMTPVLFYGEGISENLSPGNQTPKMPFIRGRLPGWFQSLYAGGSSATFWPHTRTIDGQAHWLIGRFEASPNSQGANAWINMVDW